ncbi:MAG: hypothetical protein ACLQVD_18970 [Capsulimonadaceae bacterium]
MNTATRRITMGAATTALAVSITVSALVPPKPVHALPIFTRRYGAPCQTCHTIPPKLNRTGLVFQANYFNWPNSAGPKFDAWLHAVPISGLMTNVAVSGQGQETLTAFQTLELFASDGFDLSQNRRGGYWIDYFAVTNTDDQPATDLDGAFVSLPLAGDSGQLAVTAGQFDPLTYQWDSTGSLTNAMPAAFDTGAFGTGFDNIIFDQSQPGVRLEYDDNRGKMTANGDFVEAGVPFDGHLSLNRYSQWDGPHGEYLHAFKRVGLTSAGVFYYTHDGNNYGALIGTRHLGEYVDVLGIAADGHDINGEQRYLSGQADFVPFPWLAVSGRYESIAGSANSSYPVFTLTYYPARQYWLRISAETVQQPASRSNTVYALVQL